LNEREAGRSDRLPPGQYLKEKWPVLHLRGVPKVDLATWDFTMDGLIEQPVRLTRDQLLALPAAGGQGDVHCVTRLGSLLDSTLGGGADYRGHEAGAAQTPTATHVMYVRSRASRPIQSR